MEGRTAAGLTGIRYECESAIKADCVSSKNDAKTAIDLTGLNRFENDILEGPH